MYGETNFCGCGKKYPIVPGSNPSLVTWDGQKFVVADGTKQLPINLPYIQHTAKSNAPYILTANSQGVLKKLLYSTSIPINYLLVGGGASAGDSYNGTSGGGGAGGVLSSSLNFKTGTPINISVGKGGVVPISGSGRSGNNGQNSTLTYSNVTLTAIGGGRGGSNGTALSGGSGGGGNTGQSGGAGTPGQGYAGLAGGVGTDGSPYGGGGGGAGGAGTAVQYNGSGNCLGSAGGAGIISSITGTSLYYSVGGSGNASVAIPDEGYTSVAVIQTTGYGGYGSGGQSAAYGLVNFVPYTPYAGFDGVCILSIPTQYFSGAYTNATVTTNGSNTILTFTGNGTYTT
jgi:hypothetical protein